MVHCVIVGCDYTGTKEDVINHLNILHALEIDRATALFDNIPQDDENSKVSLVEAAEKLGAVKVTKEFDETRGIKDVLGESKVNFFPDLPRIAWDKLVHQEFIIKTIKIIEDWDSMMGTSDFPLLRVQTVDGKEYTTLGSGIAILKQAKKLLAKKMFPVRVKLNKIPSGAGEYYLLE